MELMKGSLNTFLNAFTYPDRNLFTQSHHATCRFRYRRSLLQHSAMPCVEVPPACHSAAFRFNEYSLSLQHRPRCGCIVDTLQATLHRHNTRLLPCDRISTTWWTCIWMPCSSPTASAIRGPSPRGLALRA